MQTVFPEQLLARLRTLHDKEKIRDDDTFQDPDDSGPRLSVTSQESSADEIYALPAAQAEQTSGRHPDTPDQSNAPQSPPIATAEVASTPVLCDLLDPAVLATMPSRVAAFMLYEPAEPPAWRYRETAGQRESRAQAEADGAWAG
jgi:hypothetical protein